MGGFIQPGAPVAPKTVVPQFNSMIAFLVPRDHSVTEMSETAPTRYSVFGWFSDEDQSVPDVQQTLPNAGSVYRRQHVAAQRCSWLSEPQKPYTSVVYPPSLGLSISPRMPLRALPGNVVTVIAHRQGYAIESPTASKQLKLATSHVRFHGGTRIQPTVLSVRSPVIL